MIYVCCLLFFQKEEKKVEKHKEKNRSIAGGIIS